MLRAIVATPGAAAAPTLSWSLCAAPRPPTEDNPVAAACVGALAELATGPDATLALPVDACQIFGPDPRQDGGRPREPDLTGGYYQPIRVRQVDGPLAADDQARDAFGLPRLECALAGAPFEIALAFRDTYQANRNPAAPVLARVDGAALDQPIAPGTEVALEVRWTGDDAERYVAFDREAVELVTRREGLRATWYADGGELAVDATGTSDVLDDDATPAPALRSDNAFIAPRDPGDVRLWVVLRDSRGGAAVVSAPLRIE